MRAPSYYRDIVTCTAGCPVVQNCNVDRSLSSRWLPRGTSSRCKPGRALLMVVLANPGNPQEIEDEHYGGKAGGDLADASWAFTEAVLERRVSPRLGAGRSATHDTLMSHLAEDVFGCAPGGVLDRVVITNVVRCSTPRNFGEYAAEVRSEIGAECVKRHLLAEIAYWNPKLIVAAGKPVRELLTDLGSRGELELDFVATHHPSARGRFIRERKDQFREIGEMLRTETAS